MKIATHVERMGQVVYLVWKQGFNATASSVARDAGISQPYASRILNEAVKAGMLTKSQFQHRANTVGYRYQLTGRFYIAFMTRGYRELFQDHHIHIKTRKLESEYADAMKGATSW